MKYSDKIKELTLDEKINLLCGVSAWDLDTANGKLAKITMNDGPHGLRKTREDWSTIPDYVMPALQTVASTWDPEMARLQGATIAQSCIEHDTDILLAPGVNIKRTPLCGRNFEYFSEDPILAGQLGKAYIEGVQGEGIGTSLKHFCCNNREYDRFTQNSEVDERTIREIYTRQFEIALEAKPWTVMCSYNPVNGVYTSESKKILTTLLRDTLGFDGVVLSDWGAVQNSWKAVKAGCDVEMGSAKRSYDELKAAYDKGILTEEDIDKCVVRILDLIGKAVEARKMRKVRMDSDERHQNARHIAEEGIVLLKNDGVLPLDPKASILVAGHMAGSPRMAGEGSSKTIPSRDLSHNDLGSLIKKNILGAKVEAFYEVNGFANYCGEELKREVNIGIKMKAERAYENDIAIVCVEGPMEAEMFDRTSIRLPLLEEQMIEAVASANPNTIVCIYAGSAIDVTPWADLVAGIVYVGYAGEGGHEALADILTGKVVPSGKIAETFPRSIEDTFTGTDTGDGFSERYDDGIYVGYRYYDEYGIDVQYPFGYGLSYANFEYSDLNIKKITETDYEVSYKITNNSDYDAKEISQVYVSDVFAMVGRPLKELKAFSKDLIKAHKSKTVTVKLDARAFAFYSVAYDKWHIENGAFEIYVGGNSQDLPLAGKIEINLPDETQQSTYYRSIDYKHYEVK